MRAAPSAANASGQESQNCGFDCHAGGWPRAARIRVFRSSPSGVNTMSVPMTLGCLQRARVRRSVPWLGPESKNVPVGIYYLHLVGPRPSGGFLKELNTLPLILGKEWLDILNPNPQPGPWLSLGTLAQHDGVAAARDRGHVGALRIYPIHLEAKDLSVVLETGGQATHAQDRHDALHLDLGRFL